MSKRLIPIIALLFIFIVACGASDAPTAGMPERPDFAGGNAQTDVNTDNLQGQHFAYTTGFLELMQRYPNRSQTHQPIRTGGTLYLPAIHGTHQLSGLLNPMFAQNAEVMIANIITPGLFARDANNRLILGEDHNGPVIMEIDAAQRRVYLRMREGVTIYWHDGVELTLADLHFAYMLLFSDMLRNIVRTPQTFFVRDVEGWIQYTIGDADYVSGLRLSTDERELEIQFATLSPAIMYGGFWDVPMPRHHFDMFTDADSMIQSPASREGIVGFGPFKLYEVQHGERIVLTAFQDYWQGPPLLDSIVLLQRSFDTMTDDFAAGVFDVINVQNHMVSDFRALDNASLLIMPLSLSEHIYFNLGQLTSEMHGHELLQRDDNHPIADYRFRRALSYAINNVRISQMINNIDVAAATSVLHPLFAMDIINFENPGLSVFDIDHANALLDAAGYTWGSDGFRQSVFGAAFYINIALPNFVANEMVFDVLRGDFAQIGVDLRLYGGRLIDINDVWRQARFGDPAAVSLPRRAQANANPEMHMFWMHMNAWVNPIDYVRTRFSPTDASNLSSFTHPALDDILEGFASDAVWDEDNIHALLLALESLMYTQAPMIPMAWTVRYTAVNTRVDNWSVVPGAYHPDTLHWHKISVSDALMN